MINWNVLVKSRNNAEAAREVLAKELYPEDPNCLESTDLDFVDRQDYITAVPVEIALTVDDRKALRKASPDIKWIITGVKESDITNLVANYGYKVIEPEIKAACPDCKSKAYFEINGKEVSQDEFEKAISESIQGVITKFFS